MISKRLLNKLPDNLKTAILARNVRKQLQHNSRSLVRKDNEEIKNSIETDFGVKLIKLSDTQLDAFRMAVQPVYTDMQNEIGVDIIRMVKAEIKKYREKK